MAIRGARASTFILVVATSVPCCSYNDWTLPELETGSHSEGDASHSDGSSIEEGSTAGGPRLVGTATADSVTISVDGRYRIELPASNGFQPAHWLDLSNEPSTDLAGATLVEPFIFGQGDDDHGVASSSKSTLGTTSFNAARAVVKTSYVNTAPSATFRVEVDYQFWANGRIAINARFINAGTADVNGGALAYLEFGGARVSRSAGWAPRVGCTNPSSGYMFQRSGEVKSNLLVFSLSAEVDAHGNAGDANYCFWDAPNRPTFAPGVAFERNWEWVVWPSAIPESDLPLRANDVRAPEVASASGMTAKPTYEAGAYVGRATGDAVSLRFASGAARYAPAIVISDWPASTFTIKRGTTVVASSSNPATDKATADYETAAKTLVFCSTETIAKGAGDDERTFTISP